MRPDQCGTGRNLDALHPLDRAAVQWFGSFLQATKVVTDHLRAVEQIVHGKVPLQLISAPPYRVDDFVKVVDETDPNVGRWGIVVDVIDYRDGDVPRPDRLDFLVVVSLKTTRPGVGVVEYPPGPVPFEPVEIAPLFAGRYSSESGGGTGDYVKAGRVVSAPNWPATRTGVSETS